MFDACLEKGHAVDESVHSEEVSARKFKGKAYRLGHTLGNEAIPVADTIKEDYVNVEVLFYKDFVVVGGKALSVESEDAKALVKDITEGKIPRLVTNMLLPRYQNKYSDVPTVALKMSDYGDDCYKP